MKYRFCTGIVLAATILLSAILPAYAEFVFSKDGSILEGQIISDARDAVTIRATDRKAHVIKRGNIIRILYTELKMGKIYIQKRDGEGLVAYMVDEDRSSYTFRKELYKPAEFTLARTDVLFIAEKNPSGLKGEAGTNSIDLAWLPPYDVVKKYNIYITEAKGKVKPVVTDYTKKKSMMLKNLKSNTTYFIYVTSVDSDGYESNPSNELKITTKNIPPSKPEVLSIEKGNGKDVKITWKESADPDGKVKEYRIYTKLDGRFTKAGDTTSTVYTIPSAFKYDSLYVCAVDDRDEESGKTSVNTGKPSLTLSVSTVYCYPMHKLKDLAKWGAGGMAFFSINAGNWSFGLESGFIWFKGEVDPDRDFIKTNSMYMVPASLRVEYFLYLTKSFKVVSSVSAGSAWIYLDSTGINSAVQYPETKTRNVFDPLFKGGLTLRYDLTGSFALSLGSEYGYIYETDGGMDFVSFNCGAHYSF